ncbi:hypothetical protein V6N11_013073 [Hibiscus sabdariffa]
MEKLKENDSGLGWNYAIRTIDASEEWWKSRLQVVPEAPRFRTEGIDPELEEKLDQMFRGIMATSDKAWAPSSADNMIHATSRLTPAMDPFSIQHAIKILDGLSEEVPKASEL